MLEDVVGHVEPVFEVPPGVDVEEFVPQDRGQALAALVEEARRDPPNPGNAGERLPDEGNAERLAAFLGGDEPTVVYFGKLIENKGVQLLLEALRGLDVRAVIVGFGDYRAELEALAGPRVLFTGPMEHRHLVHLLPLADVAVVPSIFPEAFGMVAAEAAACGCPPLVARHSGLAEVAEGLEAEYPERLRHLASFETGDVDDLRTKLAELLGALGGRPRGATGRGASRRRRALVVAENRREAARACLSACGGGLVCAAAHLSERRVESREQRADHAERDERRDHATPQDEQRARGGAEQGELPPGAERSSEGNCGSQDRADRGRACAAEERPRDRVVAQRREVPAADEHEQERGGEGDRRREQRPADARRRVADGRDRVRDRAGRDLPEGDGVQELRARHPVVVLDGVVLHQRDDHEAAAVGEGADLEGDPGERRQAADGTATAGMSGSSESVLPAGRAFAAISTRPQATRTRTSQGPIVAAAPPPRTRVRDPAQLRARAAAARRDERQAGLDGNGCDARAGARGGAADPERRRMGEEDRCESEDRDEPGKDERDAPDQAARRGREAARRSRSRAASTRGRAGGCRRRSRPRTPPATASRAARRRACAGA